MITQVSVFAENKKGAMRTLLNTLSQADINILGYVTNDSAEFGIVRIITSDNDKTYDLLTNHGYLCKLTKVIGVELEDKPGMMAQLLDTIQNMNINVDYLYLGYSRESNMPVTLFACESMEEVENTLKHLGYRVHQ